MIRPQSLACFLARLGSFGFLLASMAIALANGCAGVKDSGAQGSGGKRGGGSGGGITPITGTGGFWGLDAGDAPSRVIGTDALGDAACAVATQKAEQVPLDIYVMMDSSGSMTGTLTGNTTTTKWTAVRAALSSFLQDTRSAGLGVGLQYFPLIQAGTPSDCSVDADCGRFGPCDILRACSLSSRVTTCNTNADCGAGQGTCVRLGVCGVSGGYCTPAGPTSFCSSTANDNCVPFTGNCRGRDKCDGASYATPAVEVAPLPGAAAGLVASLNQHEPDGLTPTAGALAGAIEHARALARVNPTHKVVVLLATDGLPSECDPSDINGVAALASAAFAGTPSIATYVIGVFSQDEAADAQMNLDRLAAAGGTGQAFVVNTAGTNVTQTFVNALNSVRSSGLSCQYMVPPASSDGGQLDYFSVNVQFTSGGGQTTIIGNVKDRASCSPRQGGWYYDADPSTGATPKTISICDSTCAQLKADPVGRVDVLLGCQTIIIVG